MRTIAIVGGSVAIVDEADFESLFPMRWYLQRVPNSELRYARAMLSGRSVLMHRLIMGNPDGLCVDHINRNGLDNRRANLRTCTHAENMRNRNCSVRSATGIKGIYNSPSKRFVARIKYEGKTHNLGTFDTMELARAAYAQGAARLHGAFARTA